MGVCWGGEEGGGGKGDLQWILSLVPNYQITEQHEVNFKQKGREGGNAFDYPPPPTHN